MSYFNRWRGQLNRATEDALDGFVTAVVLEAFVPVFVSILSDLYHLPFASVIVPLAFAAVGLYFTLTGLTSLRGRSLLYLLTTAFISWALQDWLTVAVAIGIVGLNIYLWIKGSAYP